VIEKQYQDGTDNVPDKPLFWLEITFQLANGAG
jgi:hypothetical protein